MQELLDQQAALKKKLALCEEQRQQWQQQLNDVTIRIFKKETGLVEGQEFTIKGKRVRLTAFRVNYGSVRVFYTPFNKDGELSIRSHEAWGSDLSNMKMQLTPQTN